MNPICINKKGVGVQGIWKMEERPMTEEETEELEIWVDGILMLTEQDYVEYDAV
jgi:hypothetical protein